MKRLIIAQIKIELDDSTDYGAANINEAHWSTIISDYLATTEYKVKSYISIQIDEIKDDKK